MDHLLVAGDGLRVPPSDEWQDGSTFNRRQTTMRNERKFAARQPKVGEVCVHCGHFDRTRELHFWFTNGKFVRPNGSVGQSQWLVCCDPCFRQAQGDPDRVRVCGEAVWTEDEPTVLAVENPYQTDGASQLAPGAQFDAVSESGMTALDAATFDRCPDLGRALNDAAQGLGPKSWRC
jgi:hypothetical protein